MRLLLLVSIATLAPAAEGYAFVIDRAKFYDLDLKQAVTWTSAGDTIAFTTTVHYSLALRPAAFADGKAELAATILAVAATTTGPGIEESIDTAQPLRESPLLGHLAALAGAVWTLQVDPRDGRVLAVSGGELAVEGVNRRAPAASSTDPPPLDAAARAAYTGDGMRRFWEGVLRFAGPAEEAMPLPPPLTGTAQRTWNGAAWKVSAAEPIAVTLHDGPSPVAGRLLTLSGTGTASVDGGYPGAGGGTLSFTVELTALTQPVTTSHVITWTFAPR